VEQREAKKSRRKEGKKKAAFNHQPEKPALSADNLKPKT
jgi:hypothetical protein